MVESIAELHGAAGLNRAMGYLAEAVEQRGLDSGSMSPLEKNDLLLESLGHGIRVDVSCYTDAWDWPISQGLRTDPKASYGENPNCADSDRDGFRHIDGDINDGDDSVYPGAAEPGETLITEETDFPSFGAEGRMIPIPSRIQGTIASLSDGDLFELYLPAPAVLRIKGSARAGYFFDPAAHFLDYLVAIYPTPGTPLFTNLSRDILGTYFATEFNLEAIHGCGCPT
jgi:hypothetical protein